MVAVDSKNDAIARTSVRMAAPIWALRILMGLMFLNTWSDNVRKGFYTPNGLQHFFAQVYPQAHNPLTWYANFITGVLLPHRAVFGPFQFVMELAIAVALLLGIFTPIASVGAAFLILNIFLATFGVEWPWTYINIFAILLICAIARAGRTAGVDGMLLKRFGEPKVPLW